jgi:hypothetical protein
MVLISIEPYLYVSQGLRDARSFELYHKIKVLIQEIPQRIKEMERIMHKGYNNP